MNLTLTVDICEPIFGNGSRFDEPKELGNQSANSWYLIWKKIKLATATRFLELSIANIMQQALWSKLKKILQYAW